MSIIQELQDDILDSKTNLSSILRKAKVLAYDLKNEEFKKWVDNELNGYSNENEIPDYRKSMAYNFGHFIGSFGRQMKNAPIPTRNLPEPFKKFAEDLVFYNGVRALESLIEDNSDKNSILWPADMVAIVSDKIYEDMVCISAWKSISRSKVEQILDTVRNRLLNVVLELREKYPDINESNDALSKVPKEQVASIFNTYILGSNNVVASGIDIEQNVSQKIIKNDIDGLLKYMKEIGVPAEDASQLKNAIAEDGPRTEQRKFGSKVADWVGKMTKKILEGTWNVAITSAPTLITKALSRYYGWE